MKIALLSTAALASEFIIEFPAKAGHPPKKMKVCDNLVVNDIPGTFIICI